MKLCSTALIPGLILALFLVAPACEEATAGSCAEFVDVTPDEALVADGAVCGDVNIDPYSDGLARVGQEGRVRLRFVAASQSPPDVGLNTWTLEVIDASCQPISTATVEARPFMNHHDHGTVPALHTAVAADGPGRYELGPMDLMMGGWWEVTFTVTLEDGSTDTVVVDFCLEG